MLQESEFWTRVEKTGSCWFWKGGGSKFGYGWVNWRGERKLAHRFVYELVFGPIPDGLSIDHICHNADPTCLDWEACPHRRCVNPDHLEAIPTVENVMRGNSPAAQNARKTHCRHGHPFDELNTYILPGTGHRECRECQRVKNRRRYAAIKDDPEFKAKNRARVRRWAAANPEKRREQQRRRQGR